ncbi:MAG TPA: hypothetical protein VM053_06980 [Gemmatimonadaceae bacterium]|nr:hypothetical protein [Gemmatimonadaceae bacterium]
MRKLIFLIAPIAAGLLACDTDLAVTNPNNPDVTRVLARPVDVETSISNSYGRMQQAAFGGNTSITPALLTMSFENSSDLNNFGMGPRSGIPRVAIANNRGNLYQDENFAQFSNSVRAARAAADGINSLDRPGFTIGSAAADQRARAFAWLVIGAANGNVALAYDSMTIVSPGNKGAEPKLLAAKDAMVIALAQLDTAIAVASAAPGFTLPTTWVNGNAFTSAQMIQLARGWKARLRAGVARSVAERKAVNWDAVIADAGAALPTDLMVTMSNAAGSVWTVGDAQHYTYDTWSQQSPIILGMADSARACGAGGDCYDGWLQTPLTSRYAFLIKTKDQRLPSGETRADQRNTSGAGDFPSPPRANLYYRNRRPTDPAGSAFNLSQYDYYRFQAWANTRNGAYPLMTRAEMDLLMAEGYIYKGDFANAMTKINITRVANGNLPALTGITSATQSIGGGASCVPRVPQPPAFNTAACGNIMEAMKWEKRLETEMTHMGAWFFDSRGWGDLPEGTPLEWPVPFQELDVRGIPLYNLGGVGGPSSAPKGNYGL